MTMAHQGGSGNRSEAGESAGQLADEVTDLAGGLVERGRGFMDAARLQATDYAGRRKGDAAQSVSELAQALRTSSTSFEDRPNIRAVIDSAAEGLDQLSGTIRDRSFSDLYADAEAVARRSPALAAAAGAIAGFVVARLIKASSDTLRAMPADVGREVSRAARVSVPPHA